MGLQAWRLGTGVGVGGRYNVTRVAVLVVVNLMMRGGPGVHRASGRMQRGRNARINLEGITDYVCNVVDLLQRPMRVF